MNKNKRFLVYRQCRVLFATDVDAPADTDKADISELAWEKDKWHQVKSSTEETWVE